MKMVAFPKRCTCDATVNRTPAYWLRGSFPKSAIWGKSVLTNIGSIRRHYASNITYAGKVVHIEDRTLLSTVIVHITNVTFKSASSVHIISESNLIYFLLYQPSGETKFHSPVPHLNHYMYDRFYLLIGVTKVPSSNPSTHRNGLRCRQPFPSPDKIGHRSFWDPNSSTLVCNISQIWGVFPSTLKSNLSRDTPGSCFLSER